MKIKDFEFNMRELSGSLGDLGTFIPLAVGYISICKVNPSGLLVMMGLANIVTGLVYRLPMPIQPMKVLAVMAIAQAWTPSLVYASAFAMGLVWIFFSLTNIMGFMARITPLSVVRGVQVALGVLLALQALPMLKSSWVLAAVSIALVVALRRSRYAPAAIVLMALGVGIMLVQGRFSQVAFTGLTWPSLTFFHPYEVWDSLVLGGFAQIPLTATNAVIATAALIMRYWPDKALSEQRLSLSMGIMNLVSPFWGGMPMCHGAGGLAGQYYFGARTGGTNIIEGAIEIGLGLFLAGSIAGLFLAFPSAIIGAMMLLVGLELVGFAAELKLDQELITLTATVALALISNMAIGFLCGMGVHYLLDRIRKSRSSQGPDTGAEQ
ncbi:MAG: putative sulfate/molybdate transporter [Syntrophaceae bacterium]